MNLSNLILACHNFAMGLSPVSYIFTSGDEKSSSHIIIPGPTLLVNSQFVFQTFFKQGAVAVGEPFRIQYVLEDRSDIEFFPPDFTGFRMVNQPSVYGGVTYGDGEPKNLSNIIYTLEAIKPGKYKIPGQLPL